LSFVPLVYFFFVETAGRTLEDIDRYFRENHNIIVANDKVSAQNHWIRLTSLISYISSQRLPSGQSSTPRRKSVRCTAVALSIRVPQALPLVTADSARLKTNTGILLV